MTHSRWFLILLIISTIFLIYFNFNGHINNKEYDEIYSYSLEHLDIAFFKVSINNIKPVISSISTNKSFPLPPLSIKKINKKNVIWEFTDVASLGDEFSILYGVSSVPDVADVYIEITSGLAKMKIPVRTHLTSENLLLFYIPFDGLYDRKANNTNIYLENSDNEVLYSFFLNTD